jgi:hypothetical protein
MLRPCASRLQEEQQENDHKNDDQYSTTDIHFRLRSLSIVRLHRRLDGIPSMTAGRLRPYTFEGAAAHGGITNRAGPAESPILT